MIYFLGENKRTILQETISSGGVLRSRAVCLRACNETRVRWQALGVKIVLSAAHNEFKVDQCSCGCYVRARCAELRNAERPACTVKLRFAGKKGGGAQALAWEKAHLRLSLHCHALFTHYWTEEAADRLVALLQKRRSLLHLHASEIVAKTHFASKVTCFYFTQDRRSKKISVKVINHYMGAFVLFFKWVKCANPWN